MKRLLVTGADGFVGRWMVRAARAAGTSVVAGIMPGAMPPEEWRETGPGLAPVEVVAADFRDPEDVERLANTRPDAVVHLAAIASSAKAKEDPEDALLVNGSATALFADLVANISRPRFVFASTSELYGPGHDGPVDESAEIRPSSPYAVSKATAERALKAEWKASGLPVIIARAFTHTGPGQSPTYVLPALAARLTEAKQTGAHTVKAGNLSSIRDILDVRDVVRAYLLLLEKGVPGEIYNVSSGVGRRLSDCF